MSGDEGIFELRTYHVHPSALEAFTDLASRAVKAARKHAELVGQEGIYANLHASWVAQQT